ncbi:hypothetical protein Rhe02_04910 [Rhizocola hellebori]|uniref:CARDB domain-containing protein n=2 Tax=Rhizocola hellebori TaxID=1392758 RepID=A0A8J3VCC4_9ACTN|nr:hypothetical protein Rhe02_04910 [Rhizocola hellebori]
MTRALLLLALLSPLALTGTADGPQAALSTSAAAPGEKVRVTGQGWPAGQLVQLTTCGELGRAGSASCDMPTALAITAREDGGFAVDLVLGKPSRPCPCIVHVAMVGGGGTGHVDLPIELRGHPVGPVPEVAATRARVEVVQASLSGRGAVSAWFGGAQRLTLTYTVRNAGAEPIRGVPLILRVGGDQSTVDAGELAAGQTRSYQLPVDIPFAAFGRYRVEASIGGVGVATTDHDARPWGLVLLNAIGLTLIGWGVYRRFRRPKAQGEGLSSVVRVAQWQAYLVFDDAPGSARLRRLAGDELSPQEVQSLLSTPRLTNNAVIDLEALDAVLLARAAGKREP